QLPIFWAGGICKINRMIGGSSEAVRLWSNSRQLADTTLNTDLGEKYGRQSRDATRRVFGHENSSKCGETRGVGRVGVRFPDVRQCHPFPLTPSN
ncbi:hypothetical protein J6590_051186, partial [Homalodisca vitripennis]